MGLMINITVFVLAFSFVAWMLGYPPVLIEIISCTQGNNQIVNSTTAQEYATNTNQTAQMCTNPWFSTVQTTIQAFSNPITAMIAAGVVILSPNIFAALAAATIGLFGFFALPFSLFVSMGIPYPLVIFGAGTLTLMWIYAILTWWKGGGI